MSRLYMIAGEASGDLHGSNLIKALKNISPDTDVRCWGGDLMEQAGGKVVKHFRDLAFMGFAEVIMNLPTILKNISFCKEDILQYRPDVLVLIDYPGFNLRIAEWAKKQGLKVVYYIAPQVWAWKPNRVKLMKTCIDKQLVILPFEKEWFKKEWDWEVSYVGHPLMDAIQQFKPSGNPICHRPIVAVLPGSRRQEINKKLPVMLQVAKHFPDYEFVIAKAPGLPDAFYQPFLKKTSNARAVAGKTYELLSQAKAAMVTSGTATLETALFEVPEVVCYKGNPISYQIARRLIKIPFISLVNLIMKREVVKELIQGEMNEKRLTHALNLLLQDVVIREKMVADYKNLKMLLSEKGSPSLTAAKEIMEVLNTH